MDLASIYSVETDYIQNLIRYQREGLVRISDEQGRVINPGDYFSLMAPGDRASVISTLLCGKLHSINLAHTQYRDRKLFINVAPSVFSLLANNRQSIEQQIHRLRCLRLVSSQIVYEITEFEEADLAGIVKGKQELYKYGIVTALDDYGTCYSTRERALKIRAPYLKIDRSHIGNAGFVAEAVSLARTIDAKTIAEGVETRQEFEMCRELGVDYFQGYWLAKPLESHRLADYQPVTL